MSWDKCGFPNVHIAPVGRPLYALEEAARFFNSNTKPAIVPPISDTPTFFWHGDSVEPQKYADFEKYIRTDRGSIDDGSSLYIFDRAFITLLKSNFYYKILYETGIQPDNSKILEEINNFLGEELIDYSDAYKKRLYKMPGWDSRWAIQRYRLFRDMPIYTTCMCELKSEVYYYTKYDESETYISTQNFYNSSHIISLVRVANRHLDQYYPEDYYSRRTPKNIVISQENRTFSSEMRVRDFRVWFTVRDDSIFSDFGTGYKVGDSFFCGSSSDVITDFPDFDLTNYQPSESSWVYRFLCDASPVVRLEPLNKEWMTGGY